MKGVKKQGFTRKNGLFALTWRSMIMNGSTTHIKDILGYEETDVVCFFIKKAVKKTSDFFNNIVRWFSYAFPTAPFLHNIHNQIVKYNN